MIALIQMAMARAFVQDRDYVIPEDVRVLFSDVCGHRIVLTARSKVHHLEERELLADILQEVEAPPMTPPDMAVGS